MNSNFTENLLEYKIVARNLFLAASGLPRPIYEIHSAHRATRTPGGSIQIQENP
jgi:hypothetical protein